jgi:hypothetical protein
VLVGANLIDSTTELLAARLRGVAIPLTVKLAGARKVCEEILTASAPVFVTVTEIVLLDPTETVPKLAEVGLNDNVPEAMATWPGTIAENASASKMKNAYLK